MSCTVSPFRAVATVVLGILAWQAFSGRAAAQTYTWNGPFTGTVNWSAGTWSTTPPAGGGAGSALVFNHRGAGTYIANNDLGPAFQLSTLTFASAGGGFTVGNAAGHTLEIVGTGAINQNGLGVQLLSADTTLTATNTTIAGTTLGNLRLTGILSGAGGLTINNPQTLTYTGLIDLNGANTFGGGVTLQAGNLRVGNATALGTGTLNIAGGTLGASAAVTIANNINLTTDLIYSGFNGLTVTGAIGESGGSRRLVLSSMSGNTLTLQGVNTYSDATLIVVNPRVSTNGPATGLLTFSGANGSALNSPSFTVTGTGASASNATLTLDNSIAGGNNNNRIGDSAAVTLSGARFILTGGLSTSTLEDIGALSGQGAAFVTINAGTTGNTGTTLQADSLSRLNRGQFVFQGNSAAFGSAPGTAVANLMFNTTPGLSGGGGADGTTTISIIPYAIGGITATSVGTELVTYGTNGVRPLSAAANEYDPTIVSGTTTLNNVRLAAATTVTAPTSINALVLATGSSFAGSTSNLTIGSGTVLVSVGVTIPAAMTLSFGATEALLFTNSNLTVDGVLTGTNGLTKTGTSSLILNNASINVTGTLTLNQGTVNFSDPAALASFTDIRVNGRANTSTPGLNFALASGTATLNKTITVTDGFMQLLSATGATFTIGGQITGAGGIIVNGGNVELTNTTNNYTGQTRVFTGNILIGSDAVLGNSSGLDIGAVSTSGLRLTGDWTTSRSINFSFDSQVDTNGFNWTVNSAVTGTTIVSKVGLGMWTLTQAGSLGQSLTGVVTTSSGVTVNAGELRVTNPTGSATGTATVTIGNATLAATLSGTGRIAGTTTIGAAALVTPGTGTNAGTLTFDHDLTLNGTYRVDTAADRLTIAGTLTLGAASILDLTGAAFDANTTYTLASYSLRSSTFATVNGLPSTHFLNYGALSVEVVPVPEPATILLIASATLGLAGGLRRRFGKSKAPESPPIA